MSLEKTLYIGPFIHCKTLTELDICTNGTIGVDEKGIIAFVDRYDDEVKVNGVHRREGWGNAKTVNISKQGFFFPGFIDTHIHASQYPNAGIFGKSTLLDWLNTYTFPLEASFSDLATAKKIYNRVVRRTLTHGTTTACYYATIHVEATNLLAEICLQKGQRAFVGRVCMDSLAPSYYRDESAQESCSKARKCIEYIQTLDPNFDLISPIITPRFAPSCSTESLVRLGKLQKEMNVPVQTHVSENENEIALVRVLFPDSKHYTDVYDTAGLLTSKTILAHAIHLSPEERGLIKTRGAKISHCPASNTAITSGNAPIRDLLEEGHVIGLGTDVSGGYTPSILAECREALMTSRNVAICTGEAKAKLSVEEALFLATRGGAECVGLEEKVGGFDVGMEWDAQMVKFCEVGEEGEDCGEEDEGLVDVFGNESWEDRVAKWVYTGDDRNTVMVWVKGRLVHQRKGVKI